MSDPKTPSPPPPPQQPSQIPGQTPTDTNLREGESGGNTKKASQPSSSRAERMDTRETGDSPEITEKRKLSTQPSLEDELPVGFHATTSKVQNQIPTATPLSRSEYGAEDPDSDDRLKPKII